MPMNRSRPRFSFVYYDSNQNHLGLKNSQELTILFPRNTMEHSQESVTQPSIDQRRIRPHSALKSNLGPRQIRLQDLILACGLILVLILMPQVQSAGLIRLPCETRNFHSALRSACLKRPATFQYRKYDPHGAYFAFIRRKSKYYP